MARVRNNQGYRKKVLDVFIRPYLRTREHARTRGLSSREGNYKTSTR